MALRTCLFLGRCCGKEDRKKKKKKLEEHPKGVRKKEGGRETTDRDFQR